MSTARKVLPLLPGMSFTRAVAAVAAAQGDYHDAHSLAASRGWKDAEVAIETWRDFGTKAAIGGGSQSDSTFASPLVYPSYAVSEFLGVLGAGTVVGKLQGLRRVPLSTRVGKATASSSVAWKAEGAAIPVSKMALSYTTLLPYGMNGLMVVASELIQRAAQGSDAALAILREDLITGARQYLDQQFLSPAVTMVANQNPASITAGLTASLSTASTAVQIAAELFNFANTFCSYDEEQSLVLLMKPRTAIALAAKRSTTGEPAFPKINRDGGEIIGLPVITSNAVPGSVSGGDCIIGVNPSGILYGDEDATLIETSTQASLQMDSAPTGQNSIAPTASNVVSMFQTGSTAIRLTCWASWLRARDSAVGILDGTNYA